MPRISTRLSQTLMVANVLGTLLVVAIHYSSREAPGVSPTANFLVQDFICNGIARVAVPFFSFAAGLFLAVQYAKGMSYPQVLSKRFNSVLLPYLLVSSLIILFSHGWSAFRGHPMAVDSGALVTELLIRPPSFQFWFLRDLIVLVALSPLLIYRHPLISEILAAVLMAAWTVDLQPFPLVRDWYLLNIETLSFFCLGSAFALRIGSLERWIRKTPRFVALMVALWIALVAARVLVDPSFNNWYAARYTVLSLLLYKLGILTGLFSLVLLSSRLLSPLMLSLQSLTFFVFLFHEYPFHYFMGLAWGRVLPSGLIFYAALPSGLLILCLVGRFMQRHLSPLFNVLTGGRGNKAETPPSLAGVLSVSKS